MLQGHANYPCRLEGKEQISKYRLLGEIYNAGLSARGGHASAHAHAQEVWE